MLNDPIVSLHLTDEKTINPVPSIGNYSWKQIVTNTGTKGIAINASVSSELPYKKRYITAELVSKVQTKVIETPLENVDFLFDELDPNSKYYQMLLIFTLTGENDTEPISNVTTAVLNVDSNNGHHQLLSNFFLLIFLTLCIVCNTA